jgi:hypothetical protein
LSESFKIVGYENIVLLSFIVCTFSFSQIAASFIAKITQKMFQEKGFTSFKEVVSDSRCPEGLNCIWAGEVTVVLRYTRFKISRDNTMVFMKNQEERKQYGFVNIYLTTKKNLKVFRCCLIQVRIRQSIRKNTL